MAISGGPDIVEDGLVSCFDAADPNSYVGLNSPWYDLSGNENHTGNVGWSSSFLSDNGGVINFPNHSYSLGTIKTASQINVSDNDGFTMSVFLNKKSNPPTSTFQGIVGYSNIKIWKTSVWFTLRFTGTNGTSYNLHWDNNALASLEDQWVELCFSWKFNTYSLYANGILIKQSVLNVELQSIQSETLRIAQGFGYYNFYGKISNVRLYNRILSADEILQNYNATKSRYGL